MRLPDQLVGARATGEQVVHEAVFHLNEFHQFYQFEIPTSRKIEAIPRMGMS
jgi:hypothetical protein